MKWFQHRSDSYSNLKMTELLEDFGIEGYGVFWIACEVVAQQGENYEISNGKNWKKAIANISKVPLDRVERIIERLATLNMLDAEALKDNRLFIPKMAEYSDDYTARKLRKEESTDNVRTKSKKVPLDKIRLDKSIIAEASSAEIPELIKSFEELNPASKKFYGNKTQRAACENLIKAYTFERVRGVIEKTLPKTNGLEFFPTITTPAQLWEKWATLEAAVRKYQSKNIKNSERYVL